MKFLMSGGPAYPPVIAASSQLSGGQTPPVTIQVGFGHPCELPDGMQAEHAVAMPASMIGQNFRTTLQWIDVQTDPLQVQVIPDNAQFELNLGTAMNQAIYLPAETRTDKLTDAADTERMRLAPGSVTEPLKPASLAIVKTPQNSALFNLDVVQLNTAPQSAQLIGYRTCVNPRDGARLSLKSVIVKGPALPSRDLYLSFPCYSRTAKNYEVVDLGATLTEPSSAAGGIILESVNEPPFFVRPFDDYRQPFSFPDDTKFLRDSAIAYGVQSKVVRTDEYPATWRVRSARQLLLSYDYSATPLFAATAAQDASYPQVPNKSISLTITSTTQATVVAGGDIENAIYLSPGDVLIPAGLPTVAASQIFVVLSVNTTSQTVTLNTTGNPSFPAAWVSSNPITFMRVNERTVSDPVVATEYFLAPIFEEGVGNPVLPEVNFDYFYPAQPLSDLDWDKDGLTFNHQYLAEDQKIAQGAGIFQATGEKIATGAITSWRMGMNQFLPGRYIHLYTGEPSCVKLSRKLDTTIDLGVFSIPSVLRFSTALHLSDHDVDFPISIKRRADKDGPSRLNGIITLQFAPAQ